MPRPWGNLRVPSKSGWSWCRAVFSFKCELRPFTPRRAAAGRFLGPKTRVAGATRARFAGRPVRTGPVAPARHTSRPDAASRFATCTLPRRQLAKWPQWLLRECWTACQALCTSPATFQVVSSHSAHRMVDPSTMSWRFCPPLASVKRLPTSPLPFLGSLTRPSTRSCSQSPGAISTEHAATSSSVSSTGSTCVLRTSIKSPVVVLRSIHVWLLALV